MSGFNNLMCHFQFIINKNLFLRIIFIFEKIMECHLCYSFRKVVEGGANLLNVITLLVFSFRLIAGGSHFSKQAGCLFSSVRREAWILYCSLEYSVQGDKWQGSQNALKNRKAANIVNF